MIAEIVYVLCALASLACAWVLFRNYKKTGVGFLAWSAGCFACLALGNVILFIDMVVIDDIDFSTIRVIPAVLGFGVLIYGFIQEAL